MGISAQQFRLTTGSYLNSGCPKIKRLKGHNFPLFTSTYKLCKTKLLTGALLCTLLCYLTILSLDCVLTMSLTENNMTLSNCYLIHPVPLNHHIFHTAVNTGVWSLLLFLITFYRGRLWNLTSHMGTSGSKSKKGRHIPSTLGQICASFVTFWIVSLNLLLVVISNMSLLNPGPGKTNKNISVVYHNTRGLVCFSELS